MTWNQRLISYLQSVSRSQTPVLYLQIATITPTNTDKTAVLVTAALATQIREYSVVVVFWAYIN
mgnify:CR=1 FL=1